MSTNKNKIKELIRKLIRKEIEEASFTGNLDGGEGPPKTPYAFQSTSISPHNSTLPHCCCTSSSSPQADKHIQHSSTSFPL